MNSKCRKTFKREIKKKFSFLIFISNWNSFQLQFQLRERGRRKSYEHCFDMELVKSYILQTMVVCLDDMSLKLATKNQ